MSNNKSETLAAGIAGKMGGAILALLAVGFVIAVMLGNLLFAGWKIDLTENKLYTLSEGTENVLANIDEPINLYLFFSDQASEDIQSLRGYARRVREMLREFESLSDGKLRLTEVDPVPFSEEEDRAAQYGLQGVSTGIGADPLYLGLVGTNTIGDEQSIPFFAPDRESFIEYDLAKLVSTLATPERIKIGLLSGTEVAGGLDPRTGQPSSPWMVVEQAQSLFNVEVVDQNAGSFDADMSLLWIIHPAELSEATLYNIDQYLLAGGKALIFVDPLAEAAPGPPMGQGMPPQPGSSTLGSLFETWGVEFATDQVMLDPLFALPVSSGPNGQPVRHPGIIGASSEAIDPTDVITADLETVNLSMVGYFSVSEDSSLTLQPLISSSAQAESVDSFMLQFTQDPQALFEQFKGQGSTKVIAARLSGSIKTAFPDGRPAANSVDAEADDSVTIDSGEAEPAIAPEETSEHISESITATQMVLVADVDLLSDRLWVQVQNFFGQRLPSAFADNGNFVINALDNLTGSADLISVRSRGTTNRPFSLVEGMRLSAEAQYRETEQSLQSELSDLESRLGQLQSSRQDDSDKISFSPQQEAELDRFLEERARIRTELRRVRRSLAQDIEQLGSLLKVVNIGLVPLLILFFGVFSRFGNRSARARK
ncbi:MAG: hypothetical protein HOM55_05295 [Proteobacteria bacterium]|jgi:ABC-type uncharacterized transport system involved in gliding motility auxiliary subunit|nr:hypothetical protein [Pseudomonadota bacterium]